MLKKKLLFITILFPALAIPAVGSMYPYDGTWKHLKWSDDLWYHIDPKWSLALPDKVQHVELSAAGVEIFKLIGVNEYLGASSIFTIGLLKEFLVDAFREGWSTKDIIGNFIGVTKQVALPANLKALATYSQGGQYIRLTLYYGF